MRWWWAVRAWVEGWLFRSREDAALREEMRFHIGMETRKLEAEGLEPGEARRQAHLRFGGTDRTAERVRDERKTRWVEESVTDLLHGFRLLRRAPGFSLGAVAALALGIGASTAAWSVVDGVLLRPLPWADADELVELRELGEGRRFHPSFPNFVDWRDRAGTLDAVVAVQPMGDHAIVAPAGPAQASVVGISRGFFETLGVAPSRGRTFLDGENTPGGPPALMVSFEFWASDLGAPDDLSGVRIELFGEVRPVVGVAPADHRFVQEGDVYFPAELWPGTVRSAHAYRVFGRLGDGVSLERAKSELDAIAAAIQAEYPGESQAETVEVRRLTDVLLGPQRRPLGLLFGAAVLVLLVVAVNVGSTVLARGIDRSRELAVRTSLGAPRGRLVRQMLFESTALALVGGLLGVGLAWGLTGAAVRVAPEVMPRMDAVGLDLRVLAFAAATTLGTTLLFGLFPALRLSAAAPGIARGARGGTRRHRGWGLLLGLESALAVVLLIGAGLMVRTVDAIVTAPPNWNDDGVLEVRYGLPNGRFASVEELVAFLERVRDEVASIPGVAAAGLANLTPLGAGNYTAPASDPARPEVPENYTGWRVVDPSYFTALEIPVLRGRLIEAGARDEAVVNEALAELLWPGEDPVGRMVDSNYNPGEPFRVVGVVANAGDWRWDPADQTELYVPWQARPEAEFIFNMRLVVRAEDGDALGLVPAVRDRLSEVGPTIPWEYAALSSALAGTATDRRFLSGVLATFAAAGGGIALVGILGVVGYVVGRRRRELGVRMALGARTSGIRLQILRQLAASVVPGVLVGIALAALASRLLAGLLYEVSPLDPLVYGAVAFCFVAAALLAGDLPARRGARTDPAIVLREE